MNLVFGISVYFVVWWTVLFAILPLGNRTHAEEGTITPGGGDPGAPVNPNLKRKALTTTWVAAIVWAAIWAGVTFHLFHLPDLPSR